MNNSKRSGVSQFRLLKKIRGNLLEMGESLLYHVLLLYNTLQAPGTPIWYRTVILGSLGYFISTIDGIPDMTPVLGFSDDLVVLTAAVSSLGKYITPEIKEKSLGQAERIQQRLGAKQDISAS